LDLDFPSLGAMLKQGEFSAAAMGGIGIEARVHGKKIEVFSAEAGVARTTCGWDLTSDVRLFGDQIASWDTTNGSSSGLPNLGADKDTPPQDVSKCKTVVEKRGEKAAARRDDLLVVRVVRARDAHHVDVRARQEREGVLDRLKLRVSRADLGAAPGVDIA
jgi:hypothetical protein